MSATDEIETSIAPSAIERAMAIFENFKQRDHAELVQARNTLTEHIFGQVAAGATDEHPVGRLRTDSPQVNRENDGGLEMTIRSHSESDLIELEEAFADWVSARGLDLIGVGVR